MRPVNTVTDRISATLFITYSVRTVERFRATACSSWTSYKAASIAGPKNQTPVSRQYLLMYPLRKLNEPARVRMNGYMGQMMDGKSDLFSYDLLWGAVIGIQLQYTSN
jgi:hypothetical protein